MKALSRNEEAAERVQSCARTHGSARAELDAARGARDGRLKVPSSDRARANSNSRQHYVGQFTDVGRGVPQSCLVSYSYRVSLATWTLHAATVLERRRRSSSSHTGHRQYPSGHSVCSAFQDMPIDIQ